METLFRKRNNRLSAENVALVAGPLGVRAVHYSVIAAAGNAGALACKRSKNADGRVGHQS